jgi:hypothetical protein
MPDDRNSNSKPVIRFVKRYYDFDEICRVADCVQVAKDIGLQIGPDSRTNAVWRGGDNKTSVSIARNGWHDFGTGESGSVIDLVAKVKFNGDKQEAQQFIGDSLNIEPKMAMEREIASHRIERMKTDGYKKTKEYEYCDLAGKVRHVVERWEHPSKPKEFIQRAGSKYSLKGVETVLYRLPEWVKKQYVAICEGEKDADNVWEYLSIPATTNVSGCGNWDSRYNEWLTGKAVIIFVDNDDPGERRCRHLLWELKDVAVKISVVRFPDEVSGFDVSDAIVKFGVAKISEMIKSGVVAKELIDQPHEDLPALTAAKEANKHDFQNYSIFKKEDEDGKTSVTTKPRQILDLVRECHTRLLGFPYKVGDRLFDKDRETGKIEWLLDSKQLFSWLKRKTKQNVSWKFGDGFVTKEEFFSALVQEAKQFEMVSFAPHFPTRPDVFYAHDPLPAPTPNRQHFIDFMKFFEPANEEYRILLMSFFAAPAFFLKDIPRPSWIIDSEDGAGTGKTTVVEACARLYSGEPIRTNKEEIFKNTTELHKRIISAGGRMRRIVLVDNVQGNFVSSAFADMVTANSITCRPVHGRNEETRHNDLTYVLTANSAVVDSDIAQRSFYIFLKRRNLSEAWKSEMIDYIDKNQLHIFADMFAFMESNESFGIPPATRYPEFECRVLHAFCGDQSEYESVIQSLNKDRQTSNIEEEMAARIKETICHEIYNLGLDPARPVFIRSEVLDTWFRDVPMPVRGCDIKYQIRNLAKNGLLPEVDKSVSIYPNPPKPNRRRGILWMRPDGFLASFQCEIIGMMPDKKPGKVLFEN